jgi:predicted transcriptional regulator
LLDKLNGHDAVVINEEVFDQLSSMFKSSDADNHVLAMEIMANSNYTESLLYLEMLFHEYHNIMRHNHTRGHVNFKSLLSYLNKDKNYFHTTVDDMINSLLRKKVLTVDMVNIILSKYHDEVSHGTSYFKVKTLTLSEEYLKFLNTNYLYEIEKDFVPQVIEVVEEIQAVSEVKWL